MNDGIDDGDDRDNLTIDHDEDDGDEFGGYGVDEIYAGRGNQETGTRKNGVAWKRKNATTGNV